MAGLLDFSQYDDPEAAGRLAFGATLLGAGGPSTMPRSVGQALAAAMLQGRNTATLAGESQRRNKLTDLEMLQAKMRMELFQRQQQEQAQARQLMQQFAHSPQTQAASLPGGPTAANAAMIPMLPGGFDAPGMRNAGMRAGNLSAVELASQLAQAKEKPLILSEGQQAIDPTTYKPLATNQKQMDPNKPFLMIDGKMVPNPAYQQYELGKAKAGASSISVNTGQKGFDNALKLRGDFRSEPIYKAHQDVQSAHSQIKAAIKQESPAGDLAAATKIMKILDPGSVVRESELGMAMAATGLGDRIMNYAQMTISGQKLTPQQRKDFGQLADVLLAESQKHYTAKSAEYSRLAKTIEMDPTLIVGNDKPRFTLLGKE